MDRHRTAPVSAKRCRLDLFSAARSKSSGGASSSSSARSRTRARSPWQRRKRGRAAPCPLHVLANGSLHLMRVRAPPSWSSAQLLPSPRAVAVAARTRALPRMLPAHPRLLKLPAFSLGSLYAPLNLPLHPLCSWSSQSPENHPPPLPPVKDLGEGGTPGRSLSVVCSSVIANCHSGILAVS